MRIGQVVRQKANSGWRFLQRANDVRQREGTAAAARLVTRTLREFTRPPAPIRPSEFDQQHGVDTSGTIRLSGLDVRGDNFVHGAFYKASDPGGFQELIQRIPLRFADFHFIDMGSGKGLVLLLASKVGFRRVTGVEFARELHEAALANIQRFGAVNTESVHSDASQYPIPDGPLVFYFYEPFTFPVVKKVFANLESAWKSNPRPFVILYHNAPDTSSLGREKDLRRELVRSMGWLKQETAWADDNHDIYLSHPWTGSPNA